MVVSAPQVLGVVDLPEMLFGEHPGAGVRPLMDSPARPSRRPNSKGGRRGLFDDCFIGLRPAIRFGMSGLSAEQFGPPRRPARIENASL